LKNLLIRLFSGGIYAVLTLGSILIGKYTFVVVFTIMLGYTLYEFYRLCKKGGNQPQTIFGIILAIYLFVSFYLYDSNILDEAVFFGLIPLFFISPLIELLSKNEKPVQNIAFTLLGVVYVAVPFSILNFILTPLDHQPYQQMPEILIGLFIIVWANDSGAYFFGSWLGKTKMLERISPRKTWEGALGGAIVAIIFAILLFSFFDHFSLWQVLVLAILTVVFGTLGDLTESMFKRSFNVKDSGSMLPGHGGLLDRFDSLLFAAPVYYVFVSIVLNQ
jgi:phosphatidate cytidylyltransferase